MFHTILSTGRQALINAQTNGTPFQIGSFRVGEASGFHPNSNGTGVTPSTIYTATAAQNRILVTAVTPHEIILATLMDHDIAARVGNVMLFLTDSTPFTWQVFPSLHQKSLTDSTRPYVGERYFMHYLIEWPNIGSLIDTSNLIDFYAEFNEVPTFDDLSWPPGHSTYEQYMVSDYKGRMVLTHRFQQEYKPGLWKDRWFGLPFSMTLNDPQFHTFDAGEAGDDYNYTPPV